MLNLTGRRNRALCDRVLALVDQEAPGHTLGMAMRVVDRLVRQDGDSVLHSARVPASRPKTSRPPSDRPDE
jgi:hypothetical protein